jgi:hypothetical protein
MDSLGFAVSYDCVTLPSGDRVTQPVRRYSSSGSTRHDAGLLVEVRPHAGASWAGFFEAFDPAYELTGCFGWPDPARLLVSSNGEGYVVNVFNPDLWERIDLLPIRGVRRIPGLELVSMWDFQDLALFGANGLIWRLERLSVDQLEITRVTSEAIFGRALDPTKNRMTDFTVDVSSGSVAGGWGGPALRFGHVTRIET